MKYFKQIPGYPNYVVFRNGVVYRLTDGHTPSFFLHKKQNNLRVDLRYNGTRTNKIVKRLVANAFLQNPNGYKNILHTDGDVTNLHYKNLYYTNKQTHRGGNYGVRGEAKKMQAKLTNADVAFILISNMQVTKLAKRFNVSHSLIIAIRAGKRWKHIYQLSSAEKEALAKNIQLSEFEKMSIKVDLDRNKFTKQGVQQIVAAKEKNRRKVPLRIDARTTIMVFPEKITEYKRKYNLV